MRIQDAAAAYAVCAAMQTQEDAASAKQAAQDWTAAVQQLCPEPVESLSQGRAVIADALDQIQSLQEQQGLAFEDLASKEEALSAAEDRTGALVLSSALRCELRSREITPCQPQHQSCSMSHIINSQG